MDPPLKEFSARPIAARALNGQRCHQNELAIVSVGDVSGDDDQEQLRKVLHQTDVSEMHGGMRPLVDFPADRDLLHLQPEDHHQIADEVSTEAGHTKGGVGIVGLCDATHPYSSLSMGLE